MNLGNFCLGTLNTNIYYLLSNAINLLLCYRAFLFSFILNVLTDDKLKHFVLVHKNCSFNKIEYSFACLSGDFAILIQSGMSLKKALLYNFLSACTAFVGLVLGIVLGELQGSTYIFAFAGGLFLYVSLTHLVRIKHL